MDRPYRYLNVTRQDAIYLVRMLQHHHDETSLDDLGVELARLLDEEGCRNVVLSLGPDDPDFLYSVFLAKLLNLKRRLEQSGGTLVLAELSEHTRRVLRAAGLDRFFHSYDDQDAALKALA
jgi:anti-anti-sigma factor